MNKEQFDKKYHWLESKMVRPMEWQNDLMSMIASEREKAITEHEASKTVIKAKALRKKGTNEGYFYDNKYGWLTSSQLTTFSIFKDNLVYYEYANCWVKIPVDAEEIEIDIEITVKKGSEQ